MTLQAKERLLGVLLLLVVAAIFLPMLLDGAGVRQGRLQAVLPETPEVADIVHYQPEYQQHPDAKELADPLPTPPSTLSPPPEPLAVAEPAAAPQPPSTTSMGTEMPVLDQQGVPAGWTLQLASFKKRANAVALQQKLLKRGYRAYIRDKGEISRVFVGPDLQKSVVDDLKDALKKELKLDGLVLRFRP
ncbi:MAG: DedD protein [Motiliproteus sp.]|jgi:DedD protein